MVEPTTVNIGLIVPNTGDLPGAWGTSALNPNFSAIDGLFGGVVTLSLSGSTTVTLTASSAVLTPAAGPFQQNNACIILSGSQTGNSIIKFNQPGRYVVDNQVTSSLTTADYYIQLSPASGGGRSIGAPPGKTLVLFDGTHMDYVGMPPVGAMIIFPETANPSTVPQWWAACSTSPFLYCNNTLYNIADYPALGKMLGSAHGGDGATTFKVPDSNGTTIISLLGNSALYIKT